MIQEKKARQIFRKTNIPYPLIRTYVRNVKKTVTGVFFPNYQNSNDATEACYDFIQKIMVAIDKVAPIKERRIKHNSQEWFDGEISETIKNCDKLLKKLKRSRLHINKELYNAARYIRYIRSFSRRKNIILNLN